MKKLIPVIATVLLLPQVALAAWWNPFSWKILSFLNNRKPVVELIEPVISGEVISDKEILSVVKEPSVPVKTQSRAAEKITPVVKPAAQPVVINQAPSKAVSTTSAVLVDYKNAELELIKQQNDLLKQQLQAQQQIVKNTTVVPPPAPAVLAPLPPLSFSAKVDVGGSSDKGILYPQFASNDCLGCNITDVSWFYVSLDKSVSSAVITVKSKKTGQGPYNGTPLSNNPGQVQSLSSGTVVKLGGLSPDETYEYSITAKASGYTSSTITGEFTTPSARLVALKDGSEYIFMTWGVGDNYSANIQLRSKVNLSSIQLRYYTPNDSNAGTNDTKTNISVGDIIELNNIRHSVGGKDGNGDWISNFSDLFDVVGATATFNGKSVKFIF